jgi:hypothetical protein
MKSIREWFEGTGEPLWSKLLRSMNPERSTEQAHCLSNAIFCGFRWDYTDEGQGYWTGVYGWLRSKGE